MSAPLFQHRHYVEMAQIIAALHLSEDIRAAVALHFADKLQGSNPSYDSTRFYSAAMGTPSNGRDR